MDKKFNKLREVWTRIQIDRAVKSSNTFSSSDLDTAMANIFCPGPFYFYVFDFTKLEFVYMHPNVEEIIGLPADQATLNEQLKLIHPEDIPYIQRYEEMASDFLYKQIAPQLIKQYKVSYMLRFKNLQGVEKIILHQAIALKLNADNKIITTLGTHSDVSHLFDQPSKTISFIGLNGAPSFLGLKVKLNQETTSPDLVEQNLTPRQIEILRLLAEGNTVAEISRKLVLAHDTGGKCNSIGRALRRIFCL